MSVTDTRRRWRQRANKVGLTVVGLNGEVRPAVITGSAPRSTKRNNAKIVVEDDFAIFRFPISWGLVKAIADGHVTQIRIRPNHGEQAHIEAVLGV